MNNNQTPPNDPPQNDPTPDMPLSELTASYLDMAEAATKHARQTFDSLEQITENLQSDQNQ